MFDADLIKTVDAPPAGISMMIRYWDKAGTEAKVQSARGAATAGVLVGRINSGPEQGKFIILDVVRGMWEAGKREEIIKNTAEWS